MTALFCDTHHLETVGHNLRMPPAQDGCGGLSRGLIRIHGSPRVRHGFARSLEVSAAARGRSADASGDALTLKNSALPSARVGAFSGHVQDGLAPRCARQSDVGVHSGAAWRAGFYVSTSARVSCLRGCGDGERTVGLASPGRGGPGGAFNDRERSARRLAPVAVAKPCRCSRFGRWPVCLALGALWRCGGGRSGRTGHHGRLAQTSPRGRTQAADCQTHPSRRFRFTRCTCCSCCSTLHEEPL